jgi:hypothetical protein
MMITKMSLPRRTFLRGMGVTLALPLLDAMVPALSALATTAAKPLRRVGFIYLPNGVSMNHTGINYWKPKTTGANFEISPILKPLEPFQDQMVVVSGCSHLQALALGDGQGDHTRGTATWLNGVHPKFTQGADVQAGITADQIAAEDLGQDTPLRSLELAMDLSFLVGNCENGYACTYMNTLSWRTPTMPLPTENNPRAVFERLFGEGGSGAQRIARMRRERSILDEVSDDMRRLQARLGVADRVRVTEYFDAVREVERRIQMTEKKAETLEPTPEMETPPVGIPEKFSDHLLLMFELVRLAYQADLTRVFTLMLGRETGSRIYPELGISEGHHPLSHHGNNPENMAKYARMNAFHAQLFAQFVQTLKDTPDGEGNLLDHSLTLYGAGLSDPNLHDHRDLPLALVGGATGHMKGGRHVACPVDTPMTNVLVSMLRKMEIKVDTLGDSTGEVELSPIADV